MKNLLFLFLACACMQVHAQQVPDYSLPENATKEQAVARANEVALQAARYILAMPPDTNNRDIKEAARYLILWMTETPDYTFEIGSEVKLYGSNTALLNILLAAMVEYQIKYPADKDDRLKVRQNAVKRLIAYAQDPANKVKMPEPLKKAASADQKGELDAFLASLDKD